MSKPQQHTNKILIKFIMLLVIVIAVIGYYLVPIEVGNIKEKNRVNKYYKSVIIPNEFKLSSSKWEDRGIDVHSGWVYIYTVTESGTTAMSELENTLTEQGFSQPETSCDNFYGKPFLNSNLCIEVYQQDHRFTLYVSESSK